MRRRQTIQTIFGMFEASGAWPMKAEAQRRLAGADLPVDAFASLPSRLGSEVEGRMVLTVRAMRRIHTAADTIDDFLGAVRFAGSRFRDWEAEPVLTLADLSEELSLSPRRARRTMTLLESESLVRRKDGDAGYRVVPEVGHYASVRGGRSYVRKRAAVRCGPRRGRPIKALRAWLSGRQPSLRDLIAVAVLAGLVVIAIVDAVNGL